METTLNPFKVLIITFTPFVCFSISLTYLMFQLASNRYAAIVDRQSLLAADKMEMNPKGAKLE